MEKRTQISSSFTEKQINVIKKEAKKMGLSMSAFVSMAVTQWIKAKEELEKLQKMTMQQIIEEYQERKTE